MPITLPHLFGLAASPSIDHSLVDGLAGTVRDEGRPEHVPATNLLLATTGQCLLEVMGCLIDG